MADEILRSPALLSRHESRLLVIDMQERLLAVMSAATTVIENCRLLVRGARLLGVPIDATEQYPRGLGPTVEPLRGDLGTPVEKLRFSAAAAFDWAVAVSETDRAQIVLAGIEAHVCVLQTALDLLAAGFAVSIVADAVASRDPGDARCALDRLRDHGGTVTTSEAVLFEWCESAAASEFKALSALIKNRRTGT